MDHWLTKIPLRTIIWRTALFGALLAIITMYFQREAEFSTFRDWYIAQSNYWIENSRYPGRAEFRVHAEFPEIMEVELTNRHQIEEAIEEARRTRSATIDATASAMTFRLWSFALLPMILCISLIIALPGPWIYKPLQLLGGFAMILCYTLLKVYFFTSIQFHNAPSLGIVRYTGWQADAASSLHLILLSTTFNLAVAVMIAMLTLGFKPMLAAFRRAVLKLLLLTDYRHKRTRRRKKSPHSAPPNGHPGTNKPTRQAKPRRHKKK